MSVCACVYALKSYTAKTEREREREMKRLCERLKKSAGGNKINTEDSGE